ncbi:MAG: EAL domain-containing protein [Lachnospiraceae bacterium]|nr:EAL domain-containing protein [Lachnospiraceae bacterium]
MDIFSIPSILDSAGFQISTIMICISCLYYTSIHGRTDKLHNKIFIIILWNLLVTALCNLVSAIVNPKVNSSDLLFSIRSFSQYIYFVLHSLLAPLFCFYVSVITGANQKLGRSKRFIYEFPMYVTTILTLINPLTGWIYNFSEAREYQRAWGISIIYGVSTLYFIFAVVVLLFFWDSITVKAKRVMVFFFVIVTFGTLAQLLFAAFHIELLAEALAMTGIMISIENEDDRKDSLTGIQNHVALTQDIRKLLKINSPFSIICIKMHNPLNLMQIIGPSNIGMLTGMTVEYLGSLVNKNSIYYVGPGTFVVLCESEMMDDAKKIAKTIRDRFKKGWEFQGRINSFAASLLLAEVPKDIQDISDIMTLIHASIPDSFVNDDSVISGSGLDVILRQRRNEKAVLEGLKNNSYEVFYQPIYTSKNLGICSGEALLRLKDETVGELYPADFLPIAERGEFIFELGDFVLEEVCKFLNSGIPIEMGIETLNINLSVVQCIQSQYADHIKDIISRYDIDPSRITFEIMESAASTDLRSLTTFVNKLRDFGCGFIVNDYGMGYSNIHSIFNMNIDTVKIDKSILREAVNSDIGRIILDSSISMIKKIGKKIIISGIEDQNQVDMAVDMGIDYLQGFYFSNPISQNEFITVLKATKLAKMEEQKAIASNEAMSSFLANVSHEIRTPINAVLGMDEMILRESKDEKIVEYAKTIEGAGRTLLALINDILDISKIELGKMEIANAEYELSTVLIDVVKMMQQKASGKNLSVILDVDPKTPSRLLGDERRLRQILINIMNNAVKYTEKGSVTLKVLFENLRSDSVDIVFKVKDTGIGIRQEDIPSLFDKFTRLDTDKNKTIEGTGLGLAITSQILNLMDGKIDVKSTYGKGSTFTVRLPQMLVSSDEIGDIKLLKNTPDRSKQIGFTFTAPDAQILIVDDTDVNRLVVKELLAVTGVKIDEAESGNECLEKVKNKAYDLIFLDYRMPGMDGIEVLKALSDLEGNLSKDAVIVALTANAVTGARERFLDEGFDDFITKPVSGSKLMNLLMMYLPGDKISAAPGVDDTQYQEEKKSEWLLKLEDAGINTDNGLNNCGTENVYKKVMSDFINSIPSKTEILDKSFKEKDYIRYEIEIHAVKSSARIIGADELADLARDMEQACMDKETSFVDDNHEKALSLLLDISKLKEEETVVPTKGKIDENTWSDAIVTIREFAQNMDKSNIEFILESLKQYELTEYMVQCTKEIEMMVSQLEWDKLSSFGE